MATLSQIRVRTAALLLDPNYDQTSSATLNGFINDAQEQIEEIVRLHFKTTATSSVNGTQTYTLPTDFLDIMEGEYSLSYTDSSSTVHYPCKVQSRSDLTSSYTDFFTKTGTPTYYWIDDNNFGFYPTPNYSGSSNISMKHYNIPATLSADGTSSDFADKWKFAIALRAAGIALLHQQRFSESQGFILESDKEIARILINTLDGDAGSRKIKHR